VLVLKSFSRDTYNEDISEVSEDTLMCETLVHLPKATVITYFH